MRKLFSAAMMAIGLATARFTGAQPRGANPMHLLPQYERPKDILGKMATAGLPFAQPVPRIIPLTGRAGAWNRPHRGQQEMARRRRQIKSGQLTASSGLAIHKGCRVLHVPFDMLNRGSRVGFKRAA